MQVLFETGTEAIGVSRYDVQSYCIP